jgi:hypothetical protein
VIVTLAKLKEAKLMAAAYLFEREWNYNMEYAEDLQKVLRNEITDIHSTWSSRIWSKKNWIIIKGENSYSLSKTEIIAIPKYKPFWRLKHIGVRWYCAIKNVVFYSAASLIYGPIGLKALFGAGVSVI